MTSTRRWTIVGLLCVAFMVAYFDRVNLSAAATDDKFKAAFQLSKTQIGLLGSVFFASYTLMQIPAGWAVDRFGVKMPFAICFFIWSLFSAATAWVTTFGQLIGVRLLLGVGEAVNTPAGMRWIRFNIPEKHRGLAVGIYMAAAKFGPAIGTPLATWLLVNFGWRQMFLILGLGALVWLIPWMLLVKDDDRQLEQSARGGAAESQLSFGSVVFSKAMIGTIIGTFAYQYFVYYCMSWLPDYFKSQRNFTQMQSGVLTGFSFWGMAIVAIIGGFWADRLIESGHDAVTIRKRFIFAGLALSSTELLGAYAESNDVALGIAIFSLSSLGLMTANYWALTQTLFANTGVGRIVGVQNAAANLPGVVAPVFTGWLLDSTGSYKAPMQAVFVFLLVGMAAYAVLVKREYVPQEKTV
jgi:MFS transporter, ACS family, D-galactonate transporter